MKLVANHFEKDSSGSVTLVAQDKEDLFTLYNLIQKNDEVEMKTMRNIKKANTKDGGKSKSEKKLLRLRIDVENIDFDPADELMRLRGKTVNAVEDVPVGTYHTSEIDFRYPFTLYKNEWDQISFDLVNKACNVEEKAEIAAVVLQEGIAHICLITENMTVLRQKVERSIPKKKRGDSSSHDKSLDKFYELVNDTLLRDLNLPKFKAIILASPGFVAKGLFDKIFQMATLSNNKEILQLKPKFLVTHSSTGFLQGLDEVLRNEEVQKQLSDTKFAKDVILLDEFFKSLNDDNGKAWYGPKESEKAVNMGAVKNLLLTDTLFRSDNINERKHYIELSETVKNTGGVVTIFSSLHESGKQLDQVTGVAVILNYPAYDLDEDD
jgi:protein pelota